MQYVLHFQSFSFSNIQCITFHTSTKAIIPQQATRSYNHEMHNRTFIPNSLFPHQQDPPPTCDECHTNLSVQHIILDFTKYRDIRINLAKPPNMTEALNENNISNINPFLTKTNFNNVQIFFHSHLVSILYVNHPFSFNNSNLLVIYTRLMTCDIEVLPLIKKIISFYIEIWRYWVYN